MKNLRHISKGFLSEWAHLDSKQGPKNDEKFNN